MDGELIAERDTVISGIKTGKYTMHARFKKKNETKDFYIVVDDTTYVKFYFERKYTWEPCTGIALIGLSGGYAYGPHISCGIKVKKIGVGFNIVMSEYLGSRANASEIHSYSGFFLYGHYEIVNLNDVFEISPVVNIGYVEYNIRVPSPYNPSAWRLKEIERLFGTAGVKFLVKYKWINLFVSPSLILGTKVGYYLNGGIGFRF